MPQPSHVITSYSIHYTKLYDDTPLVREMLKDPERMKERVGEVPLGRMASMQDIAEAALYLASPEGAFINGVALPVDGGVTAY